MKIAVLGLAIDPGKQKYTDEAFTKLVKKFEPTKVTPITVEFIDQDFDHADAIVCHPDKKLDLVCIDLEKIETRLQRTEDEQEKVFLKKIEALLEQETFLYGEQYSDQEQTYLKTLQFVTAKPVVITETAEDTNQVIQQVLETAKVLIFFTAGKKEVRAWSIKQGDTILNAAAKIHSDLARGFIKGEVINAKEFEQFHNMNEARSRGMVALVDRDYVMQSGDIIEIKFNV